MIHHACRHTVNDLDHPLLGESKNKPTMAGMGYAGAYRCMECGRKVRMDVDEDTWQSDWLMAPKVEPPYPEGYC